MDHYGPITPQENALFEKALRFLWERRLAKYGWEANIRPTLVRPEEPRPNQAA